MSKQPAYPDMLSKAPRDFGFQRFGAAAACIIALSSMAYSILFIFLPAAQKHGPAQALPDFAQHPTIRLIMCVFLGLGGLAGTVGAVAIYQRVRQDAPGWALWSMLLGVVVSCMIVLDAFYFAYFLLALSQVYTIGDAATKVAVVTVGILPSSVGLGDNLLIGPWLIGSGLLMTRSSYFPRLLGYIGAIGGVALVSLELVGLLGHAQGVLAPVFVATAALAGPIFWLWTAFILWTKQ